MIAPATAELIADCSAAAVVIGFVVVPVDAADTAAKVKQEMIPARIEAAKNGRGKRSPAAP
jgi:hypothetical protein